MQTDHSGLGADRVLPERDLLRMAAIPPTTFRRLRERGETPPPIQLSPRRRGYWESAALAWLASRMVMAT